MSTTEAGEQIRRLLEVGRALVAEHGTEAVLDKILQAAREITGARYAALGVLDESRQELKRFIAVGIDASTRRTIGDLPRGRGVLGVLIHDPQPLRLADVGRHPQSYGFPVGHPSMQAFLGVPIVVRGQAWGNLYLTEKEGGGEFTADDEEAAIVLALWAGTAIDNARLYEGSELRREQLERAVRSLEAARDVADAVSGAADLDGVLELIVKRGRALVGARTVLIMLREGDELVVAASAGHAAGAAGHRIPMARSTAGQALEQGSTERVSDVAADLRITPTAFGVPDAHSALLVPMVHRGAGLGVLAAFDREAEVDGFTPEDEQLLRTFASSAAHAVALNRSVEEDRLRSTIAAADAERRRWARELHDQTLQSLGGLRVALASVVGRGDADNKDVAIRQAIEDVELEIANLRGIITELRPSLLDDLGLLPAIEALLNRRREAGLDIVSSLALPATRSGGGLDAELETTIYRLVQEALTNVVKHADAQTVRVSVNVTNQHLTVEIQDDGVGFDPDVRTGGFGLAGMRERVFLAGGTLSLEATHPGTLVRASLPIASRGQAGRRSDADRVAS